MIRYSSLLTQAQWLDLASYYSFLHECDPSLRFIPHKKITDLNLIGSFARRIEREYPSYLYFDGLISVSSELLFAISYANLVNNHHSIYSSSWLEIPLSYSSYEHYYASKTLWGSGHNAIQISSESILVQTPIVYDTPLLLDGNSFALRKHSDQDNYWHWLFDSFVSLVLLYLLHPTAFSTIDNLIFISDKPPNAFQKDCINIFVGLFPSLSLVLCDNSCLCENLLYYIPESPVIHSRKNLNLVRTFLCSSLTKSTIKVSNFLFIKRGSARNGRSLLNENLVESSLEKLGFLSVDPGSLSLSDQYTLFNSSTLVVGVHGSAFVNMLFMEANTHVVELMGSSYLPIHDLILSTSLDIHYSEFELSCLSSDWTSDYYCDITSLFNYLCDYIYKNNLM